MQKNTHMNKNNNNDNTLTRSLKSNFMLEDDSTILAKFIAAICKGYPEVKFKHVNDLLQNTQLPAQAQTEQFEKVICATITAQKRNEANSLVSNDFESLANTFRQCWNGLTIINNSVLPIFSLFIFQIDVNQFTALVIETSQLEKIYLYYLNPADNTEYSVQDHTIFYTITSLLKTFPRTINIEVTKITKDFPRNKNSGARSICAFIELWIASYKNKDIKGLTKEHIEYFLHQNININLQETITRQDNIINTQADVLKRQQTEVNNSGAQQKRRIEIPIKQTKRPNNGGTKNLHKKLDSSNAINNKFLHKNGGSLNQLASNVPLKISQMETSLDSLQTYNSQHDQNQEKENVMQTSSMRPSQSDHSMLQPTEDLQSILFAMGNNLGTQSEKVSNSETSEAMQVTDPILQQQELIKVSQTTAIKKDAPTPFKGVSPRIQEKNESIAKQPLSLSMEDLHTRYMMVSLDLLYEKPRALKYCLMYLKQCSTNRELFLESHWQQPIDILREIHEKFANLWDTTKSLEAEINDDLKVKIPEKSIDDALVAVEKLLRFIDKLRKRKDYSFFMKSKHGVLKQVFEKILADLNKMYSEFHYFKTRAIMDQNQENTTVTNADEMEIISEMQSNVTLSEIQAVAQPFSNDDQMRQLNSTIENSSPKINTQQILQDASRNSPDVKAEINDNPSVLPVHLSQSKNNFWTTSSITPAKESDIPQLPEQAGKGQKNSDIDLKENSTAQPMEIEIKEATTQTQSTNSLDLQNSQLAQEASMQVDDLNNNNSNKPSATHSNERYDMWYEGDQIDSLLKLQLKGKDNIEIIAPQSPYYSEHLRHLFVDMLVNAIKSVHEKKSTYVIPFNNVEAPSKDNSKTTDLAGRHWIGISIKNVKDVVVLKFIDPLGSVGVYTKVKVDRRVETTFDKGNVDYIVKDILAKNIVTPVNEMLLGNGENFYKLLTNEVVLKLKEGGKKNKFKLKFIVTGYAQQTTGYDCGPLTVADLVAEATGEELKRPKDCPSFADELRVTHLTLMEEDRNQRSNPGYKNGI